jgi:hypothetical protein
VRCGDRDGHTFLKSHTHLTTLLDTPQRNSPRIALHSLPSNDNSIRFRPTMNELCNEFPVALRNRGFCQEKGNNHPNKQPTGEAKLQTTSLLVALHVKRVDLCCSVFRICEIEFRVQGPKNCIA